jgi:hypothetical protein
MECPNVELDDLAVNAMEPSLRMILQHPRRSNVVQTKADVLPLRDSSFDAIMAISLFCHWVEKENGLKECPCNAQRRDDPDLDPASDDFWQVQDYFSELLLLTEAYSLGLMTSEVYWSMLNLDSAPAFYKSRKERWSCPKCGEILCVSLASSLLLSA